MEEIKITDTIDIFCRIPNDQWKLLFKYMDPSYNPQDLIFHSVLPILPE